VRYVESKLIPEVKESCNEYIRTAVWLVVYLRRSDSKKYIINVGAPSINDSIDYFLW
jgi:hypothetical protein